MNFIPVNEPLLKGNEKKYLNECIDTGWISSEGPFVKEFENNMASYVGRQYGIAVSNGTAALEIAVRSLGVGKGDEVIMPTFTIISCAMALVKVGAIPVLVDSDPETWNMNVDEIISRITSRTKAILVVHIYGLPVDMNPILEICNKYGLKLIEDAAEMHGQTYYGRQCGSFGDVSIFSFYPNKHVTTGEGGMILTNDRSIADKAKYLRNLCFEPEIRYVHNELSYNYRFTNLQAAVGLAQLERLDDFIKIKHHIGKKYTQLLSDIDKIQLPLSKTDYSDNIYWVYGIVMSDSIDIDNRAMVRIMAENGIGCRTFFWCMHEQPVLKRMGFFSSERYPVAERIARKGFYIPSGLTLTDIQMERVSEVVHRVLREHT